MKKAAQFERPFRWRLLVALATGGCSNTGVIALFSLELLPVVLDETLLLAMTHAGTEFVLVHLSHGLIEVPVIFIEAINRPHHAGAVTASCTVQVKLARRRIVYHFQKGIYLVHRGIALINHGDVDIAQSCSLNGRLL